MTIGYLVALLMQIFQDLVKFPNPEQRQILAIFHRQTDGHSRLFQGAANMSQFFFRHAVARQDGTLIPVQVCKHTLQALQLLYNGQCLLVNIFTRQNLYPPFSHRV